MKQAAADSPSGLDSSPLETLLETAADTAKALGPEFEPYGHKLIELGNRFAEGRFHLAVLGQFKRGKSTLLNALTGEPILPMGVVPLTAAPTFIQYGKSPEVRVRFEDGRPAESYTGLTPEERASCLAGYVTESGNPQNRLGVAEVQVDLSAPILSSGVVLIDTPGIGSTYRHNTTATMNFLQQCDAALFLVSADPPITAVELEFLRHVRQKVPRLFYVLNKIDYLDEQERHEALSFYEQVLAGEVGWKGDFPVFCVSARSGLEAKKAADSQRWADSGMAQLETFLVDFLAREKFTALTDAISRRAEDFIEAILMEAGIALQALRLPRRELDEKITIFTESLKQAESQGRMIRDVLEGDKKRMGLFVEEKARDLRGDADAFLRDIMESGSPLQKRGKAGIQEAWAEAIPVFFEQQRDALTQSVKDRLLECLAPHEERLFNLVETLRHTAADLFQVPYRALAREEALEIRSRPYWVLNTWNTDPLPILQSMDQRLDGLVRRNVENIRWSMLQNLNVSFAGFARRVRQRLDETVDATKGAMEAAHVRREACGGGIESEAARMSECTAVLEKVKAGLSRP